MRFKVSLPTQKTIQDFNVLFTKQMLINHKNNLFWSYGTMIELSGYKLTKEQFWKHFAYSCLKDHEQNKRKYRYGENNGKC